jgi:hypothetical protein
MPVAKLNKYDVCIKCGTKALHKWRGNVYCDEHLNEPYEPQDATNYMDFGKPCGIYDKADPAQIGRKELKEGLDRFIKKSNLEFIRINGEFILSKIQTQKENASGL